jgi:phage shock protein PspC (stress-responsive transcriptional regulator)
MENITNPENESGAERPAYGTPEPGAPRYQNSGTEQPTGPQAVPGATFFDTIRSWGVVRTDEGRWVAGVCTGLARRWNMNPMVVRGLFVLLSLLTGVGLAVYGLLWLLLPHPDGRIHAQQVLTGTVTAGFFGGVIAVLLDLPSGAGPWGPWHHGGLFPLALIALVVWFVLRNRSAHSRTHH